MAQTTFEYRTSLSVNQLRDIFGRVLNRANIKELRHNSLSGEPDIGILAEQRWSMRGPNFGTGLAAAQVIVFNNGEFRTVTLNAMTNRASDHLAAGISGNPTSLVSAKSSRKMVSALESALVTTDRNARRLN